MKLTTSGRPLLVKLLRPRFPLLLARAMVAAEEDPGAEDKEQDWPRARCGGVTVDLEVFALEVVKAVREILADPDEAVEAIAMEARTGAGSRAAQPYGKKLRNA